MQSPPTVTYEEAMGPDERGLYKWLSNVDKFGFCFISGVPPTPEATEELSRRIGFIRETQCTDMSSSSNSNARIDHLGADGTFWDFTSDLAKGDTAYTTLALGAHTDTTYFVSDLGRSSSCIRSCAVFRPILVDCNSSIYLSTQAALVEPLCS